MELIMYILIFAMGTIFGSFFTLAIYRIPLKKDITHERSFCPKCNHKLGFLDLIPILSYIFLKGKCRYCGQKIRLRYLFLEILSGLVFLISYISMNFNFPFLEIPKMVYFAAFIFFYVTIVLVSGIDKEYRTINKSVVVFGVISQIIYILYLYITTGISMYRYSICLIMFILVSLFDKVIKRNMEKNNYVVELIYFGLYINLFIEPVLFIIIILLTAIFSLWKKVILHIRQNANLQSIEAEDKKRNVPIGFYLGISTIIIVLIQNFTCYWR